MNFINNLLTLYCTECYINSVQALEITYDTTYSKSKTRYFAAAGRFKIV